MPAKLVDEAGATIFEFDSDGLMVALLLNVIGQAKHGDGLRKEITLNEKVDELARAVLAFAEARGTPGYGGADGHYPAPPRGVAGLAAAAWTQPVLQLLFDAAPDMNWRALDPAAKAARIRQAFHPHRLDDETVEDWRDWLDGRMRRYAGGA